MQITTGWEYYLPSGFDAVEVVIEGASEDPDLREAEFARHLGAGAPHVQRGLGAIEHAATHVPDRMLMAIVRLLLQRPAKPLGSFRDAVLLRHVVLHASSSKHIFH